MSQPTEPRGLTGDLGSGGRVRALVGSTSRTQRVGVLAAVLVLLTAPFGGLDSAAERGVRPLRLGERLDIGAFHVTVTAVKQYADLPPAVTPEPGTRLLGIRVEVTNHSGRAEYARQVADAFSATGSGAVAWPGDDEPDLRIFDVDDAGELPASEFVNPGSSYEWILALQQRPDVDLDDLTLAVTGYHFRETDPQTLDPRQWVLDRSPLAEGHLPVEVVE